MGDLLLAAAGTVPLWSKAAVVVLFAVIWVCVDLLMTLAGERS